MPTTRRAFVMAIAALAGALAGALALIAAYSRHPGLTLDMTGDLPRMAAGFYPPERAGNEPFAWTAKRARLLLDGLDRREAWRCSVRVRAGRSANLPQPTVQLAIDGVVGASKAITNTWDTIDIVAPARPSASGLTLTLDSSSAFVPGPSDTRELGVQVNRLACEPAESGIVLPPRDVLVDAAAITALFGATLALIGIDLWITLIGIALLAGVQALALSAGPAPYTPYASQALRLAIGTQLAIIAATFGLAAVRRQPLASSALAAVAVSGIAFYLELLGLLHPSKLPIDAVFHAHRLERVLSGWYYFTQPVRNAEFPYAIALYVAAAPFASLVPDHVLLLRLVVCAANALAGALLYWMIVRTWNDGAIGVVAVALFHCLPLPFTVIGNANLTNAFGQSAALIAIATATGWRLGGRLAGRDIGQLLALMLLCALALLSHVSTLASFSLTVAAIVGLYWLFGGPSLRPQARSILLALVIAVIVSVAVYYGHFLNVFLSVGRVSAAAPTAGAGAAVEPTPMVWRVLRGLAQSVSDLGWPILLLAGVGAWRVWTRGRDRLAFALAAWGVTYVLLFLAGSLAPASRDFERYAVEFLSRLDHAIAPAVVILAATGGLWAWRAGLVPRAIASLLFVIAAGLALSQWLQWFS